MLHHIHLHTPIRRTFRTEQVAGLFDVPLDERLAHTLTAEVPGLDEDWTIGAIYEPPEWPEDTAIIECLGDGSQESGVGSRRSRDALAGRPPTPDPRPPLPLKELTRLLTAVGLGSVPAWLKPYRVLSTGERFRADVARAVLESGVGNRESEGRKLLVIDEFTSALDRTVACTASAAIAKLLRQPRESGVRSRESAEPVPTLSSHFRPLTPDSRPPAFPRLVVITCHTDILPWLAPDWTLDLGRSPPQLAWGRLQRPTVRLAVRRVPQALWARFARHHYLSGGMSRAATCYGAFSGESGVGSQESNERESGVRGQESEEKLTIDLTDSRSPIPDPLATPVAFCAVVAALGWRGRKRITRLVTLPEFQGLGIGPRLAEVVAADQAARGHRVSITASHPAILGHCSRSPRWRYVRTKKTGSTPQRYGARAVACSMGRAVASFEYVGGTGGWGLGKQSSG